MTNLDQLLINPTLRLNRRRSAPLIWQKAPSISPLLISQNYFTYLGNRVETPKPHRRSGISTSAQRNSDAADPWEITVAKVNPPSSMLEFKLTFLNFHFTTEILDSGSQRKWRDKEDEVPASFLFSGPSRRVPISCIWNPAIPSRFGRVPATSRKANWSPGPISPVTGIGEAVSF